MSNGKLLSLSAGAFALALAGMLWTEQQAGCGRVIIPLELTTHIEAFKAMIAGCDIEWLRRNTQLDFVFLITYSLVLVFGLKSLSDRLSPYAWFAFLPACFDAVENVFLIKFLDADITTISSAAFTTYYMCVRTKFAMLAIILVALIVLLVRASYIKITGK